MMMRWCIISAAMLCMLVSCASDDDIPSSVISLEQMKFIMYDVLRAQELATLTNATDTTQAKLKGAELLQQVFTIHKITREDFYKSFSFYESHPDQNKILFDSISAYANRKRQDMYMRMR